MAAPSPRLHHVTSADGTAIALEQITEGPRPLVTVPGATANRAIWAEATRALDGRFAVWLDDRRGVGDSGDTEPYAFEREQEDLLQHTLMLLGELSADHLKRSTAAVAEALPDVEVVDLPGQAHAALQTAPALVGEVLRRHLHVPG